MRKTIMSIAVFSMLAAGAAVVIPDETLASYNVPVVLDVTSDMTLSAALGEKSLSDYGTIVKKGTGILTVDGDDIASFAGDIHIWEGTWKVSLSGHLGTAAGVTYVHGTTNKDYPSAADGNGQLWFANENGAVFENETIVIEGSGIYRNYNGWGAIYVYTTKVSDQFMWGSSWRLSGDATACIAYAGAVLADVSLDLNGYALDLAGNINNGGPLAANIKSFKSVTGFGSLHCTRISMESSLPYEGSASDRLVLDDFGTIRFADISPSAPWTIEVTNGWFACLSYSTDAVYRRSKERNVCGNPICVSDALNIYPVKEDGSSLTLTGPVSGPGAVEVGYGKKSFSLYLDNSANSFEGGLTVDGSDISISLGADGSLPADGGALVLSNASVVLERDAEVYHLPDLVLAGTSDVANVSVSAESSWKNVRKMTADTAVWRCAAGGESLVVEEGTLEFASLYDQTRFSGLTCYFSTNIPAGTTFAEFKERATNRVDHCTTTRDWLSFNIGSQVKVPDGGAVGYEGWIRWDGNDGDTWTVVAASGPELIYCAINGQLLYNCDNATMNNRVLDTFEDLKAKTVTVRKGWNKFEAFTRKGWGGMASKDSGAFSWPGSKSLTVCYSGGTSTDPDDYVLVCDKATDADTGKDLVTQTGNEESDGRLWMPYFGSIEVSAGATLDLERPVTCGSLAGSGTVNGSVNADKFIAVGGASSGALAVSGDVVFSSGTVEVEDGASFRDAENLPILITDGTISFPGTVIVPDAGKHSFRATLSRDGKTLSLTCLRNGLTVVIR